MLIKSKKVQYFCENLHQIKPFVESIKIVEFQVPRFQGFLDTTHSPDLTGIKIYRTLSQRFDTANQRFSELEGRAEFFQRFH